MAGGLWHILSVILNMKDGEVSLKKIRIFLRIVKKST